MSPEAFLAYGGKQYVWDAAVSSEACNLSTWNLLHINNILRLY